VFQPVQGFRGVVGFLLAGVFQEFAAGLVQQLLHLGFEVTLLA
jgi:hypothetical protein